MFGSVHGGSSILREHLLPEIERQQKHGQEVVVRADAAFAKPEIYEVLEERGVNYAIRIPANENLDPDIAELLPRPVGRPSSGALGRVQELSLPGSELEKGPQGGCQGGASPGRAVPTVGFIVTNLSLPSREVVRFYNKRGTAELDTAELPPVPVE